MSFEDVSNFSFLAFGFCAKRTCCCCCCWFFVIFLCFCYFCVQFCWKNYVIKFTHRVVETIFQHTTESLTVSYREVDNLAEKCEVSCEKEAFLASTVLQTHNGETNIRSPGEINCSRWGKRSKKFSAERIFWCSTRCECRSNTQEGKKKS